MVYKLDKPKLINYVKENKIVCQKDEGFIEVIDDQQIKPYIEVVSLVENSVIIEMANREEMFDSCFEELAKWSTADDVLILVDNEVLLCIPKQEYKKLLA